MGSNKRSEFRGQVAEWSRYRDNFEILGFGFAVNMDELCFEIEDALGSIPRSRNSPSTGLISSTIPTEGSNALHFGEDERLFGGVIIGLDDLLSNMLGCNASCIQNRLCVDVGRVAERKTKYSLHKISRRPIEKERTYAIVITTIHVEIE